MVWYIVQNSAALFKADDNVKYLSITTCRLIGKEIVAIHNINTGDEITIKKRYKLYSSVFFRFLHQKSNDLAVRTVTDHSSDSSPVLQELCMFFQVKR